MKTLFAILLSLACASASAAEINALQNGVIGRANGSAVRIDASDGAADTALPVLYLRRSTTTTPAIGIGAILGFQVETAPSNWETLCQIDVTAVSVTTDDEEGTMVFKCMIDGTLGTAFSVSNYFGSAVLGADYFVGDGAVIGDGAIYADTMYGQSEDSNGSSITIEALSPPNPGSPGNKVRIVSSGGYADNPGAADGGDIEIETAQAFRNVSGNGDGGDVAITLGEGIGAGRKGRLNVDGRPVLSSDIRYVFETQYDAIFPTEFADGWSISVTNSGSGNNLVDPYPTHSGASSYMGLEGVSLATTTNATVAFNGGRANLVVLGQGKAQWWSRHYINTLSTAANTYTIRSGFMHHNTTFRGAYFRYTNGVNNGEWEAVTRLTDLTETATDTNVVVATGTDYRFYIEVNAAGTEAKFFINDALVATNTTKIPTDVTNDRLTYALRFDRSTGDGTSLAAVAAVDYCYVRIELTNPR